MKLDFTKMHGLGNDFVVVNALDKAFDLTPQDILFLSHRKTGIGFDQLLVIEPASLPDVDFDYRIFNADGSEVEHCGNGARCFAHFVVNHQLTDKTHLRVKVKKGLIDITYENDDNIEVDMGKPILSPASVPFAPNGKSLCSTDAYQNQYLIQLHGQTIPVSVLSVGNPHAVFMVSNIWQLDIAAMAKAIQQSAYFPESVNVNFVERIDGKHLSLRTYERGVGETLACGTGACASAFAVWGLGVAEPSVRVKMAGGELTVSLIQEHIVMRGSAREVYSGQIYLPFKA